MNKFWLTILLSCFVQLAFSKPIEFSESELERESVLPVFDETVASRNRNVTTENSFDVGGFFGMNLNEPFFSQFSYGIYTTYHISELSGIQFVYHSWTTGISNYVKQLQEGTGTQLDLHKAPAPKYYFLINYDHKAFYGKLSFAKDWIINLMTIGTAGAGGIMIGDKLYPMVSLGLAESLYFTKSFSFRLDFRVLSYTGPDYLSRDLRNDPGPVSSELFNEQFNITLDLTFGFIYLFPSL